ncbi:MAG TPA: hypothetical protein VMW63_07575 [Methanoregulaceae archaeon]|nr:hypothetical protein [Methanoregulaceae archaeon]
MDSKRFRTSCPLAVGAFLIILLAWQVSAGPSWDFDIISDTELDAIYADISGDYVIYSGSIGDAIRQNSTRVIQLYSISSGEQVRIATSGPDSTLTGEDIDGNYAVWFSEPQLEAPADIPNEIFLYSISEKNITVIRKSGSAEWPKISGESVIWSESVHDSFASSVMLYDIRTGNTTQIPTISPIDAAGIAFDGDYILYTDADTMNLLLYATGTGDTTTVFARKSDNNTTENVFGTALGGDFALYRKNVLVEKPRELYSELCLYTISTGETRLLSPITGKVTENLSESDKGASFNSLAADKNRVAWEVAEGIADDRIVVLDPETMALSSISPDTFVDFIHIDGDGIVWLGSSSLAGKGSIYLATEPVGQEPTPTAAPTVAPGFGWVIAIGSVVLSGILMCKKRSG